MTETMDKIIFDFQYEWDKICKEHHKKKDRIQAFKELWRARSELALAELTSGIMRKEKCKCSCHTGSAKHSDGKGGTKDCDCNL